MPSRSLLSCSAQVVLGRPRGVSNPAQARYHSEASPYCGPKRLVGGDTGLHASNMAKEGKSPPSDSRLDVLEACAVLHLQVCYVIEPADPEDASQAAHVERLRTIDIGLELGPCFSAVQEDRQDAQLVQAEFCNKT